MFEIDGIVIHVVARLSTKLAVGMVHQRPSSWPNRHADQAKVPEDPESVQPRRETTDISSVKKTMTCLILIFASLTLNAQTQSQGLGVHERKGLDDTKSLLKDKQQRDDYIKTDKKAQDIDNKVNALTGGDGAHKEEIYGISAEVMEKLTVETNGDPEKMKKILEDAMRNPEAFYNQYFDEKAKQRVRGVANEIEKKGTVSAPRK